MFGLVRIGACVNESVVLMFDVVMGWHYVLLFRLGEDGWMDSEVGRTIGARGWRFYGDMR